MNKREKAFFIGIVILLLIGASSWYTYLARPKVVVDVVLPNLTIESEPVVEPTIESVRAESAVAPEPVVLKPWENVFFTSQAPTGEWGRNEFQNGCEEASALMAHAWRTKRLYTQAEAKQELIDMARYQEKQISQGIDTDAAKTAELLLNGYFSIADYKLSYDFTLDELKQALADGLVIVPTNGQALKNPNFTHPGPLQHMLVITGYDEATKEFITNDPGTRKGKGYRYPEATLYSAIREYPTGKHLPITTERKAMIVIPSQSNP
ncbi:MAG: C39 family peptidase [Undibacterium sp.]